MAIVVVMAGVLPGCDLLTDPDPVPTTIEVSHGSVDIRRTFQDAAVRWQKIVTGDLPSGNISISEGPCGSKEDLSRDVDDVLILVHIAPIDGPGGVLGSAGPCLLRSDSKLPSRPPSPG